MIIIDKNSYIKKFKKLIYEKIESFKLSNFFIFINENSFI